MKKILAILGISLLSLNANAASSTAPMMMSTVAMASAMSAQNAVHKAANTVGLAVLDGKQIENCLILTTYFSEAELKIVCLNANKDEIYAVSVTKPKGAFSVGVFNELRKQFKKGSKK